MKWVYLEDGTVWPIDDQGDDSVEWRLRYGEPTREDLLAAASVMAAYQQLRTRTNARRNNICSSIKAALAAPNPNAAKEPGR